MEIRQITQNEINMCEQLIKESFADVAEEFNITKENAPRYVLFALTADKLKEQFDAGRPMFAAFENGRAVGYFSLNIFKNECEINNLCVLPNFRHRAIGNSLLEHAVKYAENLGLSKINISIIEENTRLKEWYTSFGFVHTHTEKYPFFPFTCGYMELKI